jgi:1,4-alpha-glucan branching enzyme
MMSSMIKRTPLDPETVKITFVVPDDGRRIAVIGDFNDWQADLHPLRKRSNGMRSVAVTVPAGTVLRFRYLVADDESVLYVDDPDADGLEPNGFGQTHAVLVA